MLALALAVGMVIAAYAAYPFVIGITREASREDLLPSTAWYAFPIVALTFSASGLVVHRREPHFVGWIMHGVGLLLACAQIGTVLGLLYLVDRGWWDVGVFGKLLAAWSGFAWAPALILMTVFLPLFFPTGRPPSSGWWWVGVVGAAGLVFGFGAVTVDTLAGPLKDVLSNAFAWLTLSALMVTGAVGAMASVVVRYRRAGDVERLQLKWVTFALILVCITIALAITPLARQVGASLIPQLVVMGVMCSIPVSVGIAINRYRLYEIDRIISRAASYALLTLIIAGVFVIAVFGLQQLLLPLIGRSQLAVAGATLAATALFVPFRRRVGSSMDRRFNRPRYDAQRAIEELRLRLRDEVNLDQIGRELIAAASVTVEPAAVSLWLRSDANGS